MRLKPEAAIGHPTQATSGCDLDKFIRSWGWEIAARSGSSEPWWRKIGDRPGRWVPQSQVLLRIGAEVRALAESLLKEF